MAIKRKEQQWCCPTFRFPRHERFLLSFSYTHRHKPLHAPSAFIIAQCHRHISSPFMFMRLGTTRAKEPHSDVKKRKLKRLRLSRLWWLIRVRVMVMVRVQVYAYFCSAATPWGGGPKQRSRWLPPVPKWGPRLPSPLDAVPCSLQPHRHCVFPLSFHRRLGSSQPVIQSVDRYCRVQTERRVKTSSHHLIIFNNGFDGTKEIQRTSTSTSTLFHDTLVELRTLGTLSNQAVVVAVAVAFQQQQRPPTSTSENR